MSLKLVASLFIFVFFLPATMAYGDNEGGSVAINLPPDCTYTPAYDFVGSILCENNLPDFSAANRTFIANAYSLTIDHCISTAITRQHFKLFRKLQNLKIFCDEIEVEDGAFDDLTELMFIFIENSAITFPGDLFCPLNSLMSLTINNNRISSGDSIGFGNCSTACATKISEIKMAGNLLTSIDKDGFLCNINSLHDLDLKDNAIASIEKEAFARVPNLYRLSLGGNKIKELPRDTFEYATNLFHLNLSNNQLSQLSADVFKPLTKLYHLDLSGNLITVLSPGFFSSLLEMKYLYLSNNQIQNVDNVFHNVKKLYHINLSGNRLETIDANTLDGLQSTEYLFFNNNNIKTIVANVFDTWSTFFELDLSYNRLKKFPELTQRQLIRNMQINHNEIDEFNTFDFNFTRGIVTFGLSYNKITSLGPYAFALSTKLTEIDLSNNIIETVDNLAFDGLSDLRKLNLSGNRISFQNNFLDLYEKPSQITVFTALKSLLYLDLSNNRISDMAKFQLPSDVVELLLNGNNIKSISPETFNNLTHLSILNLRNNSLTTLPKLQLPNPSTELMLRDNPFLCDCGLSWLNDWRMGMSSIFDLQSMTCSVVFNPEFNVLFSAESYQILELKKGVVEKLKQNFLCAVFQNKTDTSTEVLPKCSSWICTQQQLCPDHCICYHNLQWTNVKMVCSNSSAMVQIPQKIPMATNAAIFYNVKITLIDIDTFQSYTNVTHLSIRHTPLNYIDQTSFQNMKLLKTLDMTHNELGILDQSTFAGLSKLKRIDLSYNKLSAMGLSVFDDLKSLESLNIANNYLTNWPVWSIDGLANVYSLAIGGNPWSCDCSFLIPLKEFLVSHSGSIVNVSQLYCKRDPLSDQVILLRMFNITHCTWNNNFLNDFDSIEYEKNVINSNVAIIVLGFLFSVVVIVLGIFIFVFRVELKIAIARRIRRSLL